MRAVAAQSIRRNSSSTLYSRNWSNSVPPPRPCAERRPTSRMRALLIRSSASSRDRKGGYTRSTAGSASSRCRAANPSGPSTRTTTVETSNRPRRVGVMVVVASAMACGRSRAGTRRRPACNEGASSSATATRTRRFDTVLEAPGDRARHTERQDIRKVTLHAHRRPAGPARRRRPPPPAGSC